MSRSCEHRQLQQQWHRQAAMVQAQQAQQQAQHHAYMMGMHGGMPGAAAPVMGGGPVVAKKSGELPLHGNKETFNINGLVAENIMGSDYFRRLSLLTNFEEMVEEIKRSVHHAGTLEVWWWW
jgi:hypothetical protein